MRRTRASLSSFGSHFSKVFLLNLDRRPDRWHAFQEGFREAAGEDSLALVERVSAVDGSRVDMDALLKRGLLSRLGHRRLQEPPARRIWGMDLTPGAVGCALSHIKLWGRIAAAGAATPASSQGSQGGMGCMEGGKGRPFLVMEDDCVFPPRGVDLASAYEERLRHVPSGGWDLLYLSGLDTANQCPQLMVGSGVARVPQFHRTTNAYVITPSGAEELLALTVPLTYQLDTTMTLQVGYEEGGAGGAGVVPPPYVRRPRCYTLVPPLITQSALSVGDVQDGEERRTPEERRAEEADRRRAAGWRSFS